MTPIHRAMAVCLMFASQGVAADEQGNAAAGLAYARAHCAECHSVETTEDFSPEPGAPSFLSVAKTPGMTARALTVWLQSSHAEMPNIMVDAEDRDDVIAYILSLKFESQ